MVTKQRDDLLTNIPALRKLDSVLLVSLITTWLFQPRFQRLGKIKPLYYIKHHIVSKIFCLQQYPWH